MVLRLARHAFPRRSCHADGGPNQDPMMGFPIPKAWDTSMHTCRRRARRQVGEEMKDHDNVLVSLWRVCLAHFGTRRDMLEAFGCHHSGRWLRRGSMWGSGSVYTHQDHAHIASAVHRTLFVASHHMTPKRVRLRKQATHPRFPKAKRRTTTRGVGAYV